MTLPDSRVSIADSNRASCKFCGGKIMKGNARVTVYEKSQWHDGFDQRYVHAACCKSARYGCPQTILLQKLMHPDDYKKFCKVFTSAQPLNADENAYCLRIWELREGLSDKKILPLDTLAEVLKSNDYQTPEKRVDLQIHYLADALLSGKAPKCPSCDQRTLVFTGVDYECGGYISATTRCPYKTTTAPGKREVFEIPYTCLSQAFFRDFELPSHGLVKPGCHPDGPAMDPNVESEDESAKSVPKGTELTGFAFFLAGKLEITTAEVTELIEKHGGTVVKSPKSATHVITTEEQVKKKKPLAKLKAAKDMHLPFVTVQFVQDLCGRKLALRQRKNQKPYLLSKDTGNKIPPVKALLKSQAAEDEGETGAAQEAEKRKKKKGAIRPGSALLKIDDFATLPSGGVIYVDDDNTAHNVTLTSTDITTGVNKFYIIQLIQSGKGYILFCRWGRVGDSSGKNYGGYSWYGGGKDSFLQKRFGSVSNAIKAFDEKFRKFSGNTWADASAGNFKHLPAKYNMIVLDGQDDDDDDDEEVKAAKQKKKKVKTKASAASDASEDMKLADAVRDFVKMITDEDMMRKALQGQNIDLRRMPLGSLSKKQMKHGYAILQEVLDILQGKRAVLDDNHKSTLLLDCTQRFYNEIPHEFARGRPPTILNNMELLKRKIDLMEQLMEISTAKKLFKDEAHTDEDPIVANYKKLNCQMQPVATPADLKMIKEYVHNTHASTHSAYNLEVISAFEVTRESETGRFEPFASKHRRLLWHGSRLTNWVGILSQGLRIAPPEAPVTGYMFDKGVYFADMVSKSANYCFASRDNPFGVLLLCEVAVGDMMELKHSDCHVASKVKVSKKDSVLGVGKTAPDPKGSETAFDGVHVPKGKGIPNAKGTGSSLLYNEYIVYSVSQVKMRYVLKVKFNYK